MTTGGCFNCADGSCASCLDTSALLTELREAINRAEMLGTQRKLTAAEAGRLHDRRHIMRKIKLSLLRMRQAKQAQAECEVLIEKLNAGITAEFGE